MTRGLLLCGLLLGCSRSPAPDARVGSDSAFAAVQQRGAVAMDVDQYSSEAYQTTKTKKVMKNHVKAEATKEHPAQVETYTEDVIIGHWTTVKFSGAVPAKEKNEMLARVSALQEAVKSAREEANGMEVEQKKMGAAVLQYVFGKV